MHISFVRIVKIQFFAKFPVDHLAHPVMSSLILFQCKFAAFAYYVIDQSLSPHNQHLLFCCILSFLALIRLVLMVLFSAIIKRDSVSLFRFPYLSHVHVSSHEMLLISCLKRPWSCLSSYFCFLVVVLLVLELSVLFLVAVISLSPWFSM